MGHKRISEPLPLPWYDQVIAGLIRMKNQHPNLYHIELTKWNIDILLREDGTVTIRQDYSEVGLLDRNFEFKSLDDALKFDWKAYADYISSLCIMS